MHLLRQAILRRLLKTHSGEKPNKCNQCTHASSQAGKLRRHFITHSEEKQIICNQCNYASSKAGILRTHVKMHSGVTSKKCNQCHFKCSCLGMPYWHYQLKYLVGIFISQSHINQVCNNVTHSVTSGPIDRTPGTPGSDKNQLVIVVREK